VQVRRQWWWQLRVVAGQWVAGREEVRGGGWRVAGDGGR
jgi:hypothetical protein